MGCSARVRARLSVSTTSTPKPCSVLASRVPRVASGTYWRVISTLPGWPGTFQSITWPPFWVMPVVRKLIGAVSILAAPPSLFTANTRVKPIRCPPASC